MIGKKLEAGSGYPSKRSVALMLARILAVMVVATLPLVTNAFTSAKYLAAATAGAEARVAIWDVDVDEGDLPPPAKTVDLDPPYTTGADDEGHPLVLFFKGVEGGPEAPTFVSKSARFPITLINNSQVAARFKPEWKTDSGTADVEFSPGGVDGVVVAPNDTQDVDVLINSSTFTGLKLSVLIEQEN